MTIQEHRNSTYFEVPYYSDKGETKSTHKNHDHESPEQPRSSSNRGSATSRLFSINERANPTRLSLSESSMTASSITTAESNTSNKIFPSFGFFKSTKSHTVEQNYDNLKKDYELKEHEVEVLKDMVLDLQDKLTNSENAIDRLEKEISSLKQLAMMNAELDRRTSNCRATSMTSLSESIDGSPRRGYSSSRGCCSSIRARNPSDLCSSFAHHRFSMVTVAHMNSIIHEQDEETTKTANIHSHSHTPKFLSKVIKPIKKSWDTLSTELNSYEDDCNKQCATTYRVHDPKTALFKPQHNDVTRWNKMNSKNISMDASCYHSRIGKKTTASRVVNTAA